MKPLPACTAAACSGFAVLALELAAVRLFAPTFGDSAYVWTNVIGVLLVALALGAWLGGRLADPERAPRRLTTLLLLAAVLTALVPVLAKPLGAALLPADLELHAAFGALVRGSLAATLITFGPPVLLAGTVTPMLVASLAHGGIGVGRASGLVAAWSTLGSLAGTFATTHVLVPELGSRVTVWVCAAAFVLAGFVCRPRPIVAAVLALPLALALVPWGAMRSAPDGAELLAEVESRYQFLQVVRTHPHDGVPGQTELKINEGLDSFHSVRVDDTPWTGAYYDSHTVAPLLAGDGARPATLRVLSLGAAAGTFERVFAAAHPGVTFDSVEIDPAVVALGRTHFGAFEDLRSVYAGLDARVFVERARDRWDVVLVDAYERQIYIPAHVASREFFTAVRERLEPGGIVSVNVGALRFDDPSVEVVAGTLAHVFGAAWAFRVDGSRNFVVVARRDRELDPGVLASAELEGGEFADLVERIATSPWRRFEPGELVLEDDRPFFDAVQERSYQLDGSDVLAVPMAGSSDPDALGSQLHELALRRDWEGVLAAASRSARPTGYLRLAVGDARWRLFDVRGARAEYSAGLAVTSEDWRALLEDRMRDADAAIERLDRAAAAATSNGWVAALGALWLAVVAWLVARFGSV